MNRKNMTLPLFSFALACSLLFVLFQNCSPSKSEEVSNSESLIIQVYESLFSGLSYLEKRKEQMMLDSAMGVRIVIDQSKFLMPLTGGIHRRMVHQLKEQASKLLHESFPYVMRSDFKTFQKLKGLLKSNVWTSSQQSGKRTRKNLIFSTNFTQEQLDQLMDEETSDFCLANLMDGECKMPHPCLRIMMTKGLTGYQLSHQLLYSFIAEKFNCSKKLSQAVAVTEYRSLYNLTDSLCTNMLHECSDIEMSHFDRKDLFMENVAFCAILGYDEFVKNANWITKILSWQEDTGCFALRMLNRISKRKEKIIDSRGCLAHTTAMALAALMINLKHLILSSTS